METSDSECGKRLKVKCHGRRFPPTVTFMFARVKSGEGEQGPPYTRLGPCMRLEVCTW